MFHWTMTMGGRVNVSCIKLVGPKTPSIRKSHQQRPLFARRFHHPINVQPEESLEPKPAP